MPEPMRLSIEKLQKFFKLEAERGFDNKAVVGGLEKILKSWEAEARADNVPESIIQNVISRLDEYRNLTPDERAAALRSVWKVLSNARGNHDHRPSSDPAPSNASPETAHQRQNRPPRRNAPRPDPEGTLAADNRSPEEQSNTPLPEPGQHSDPEDSFVEAPRRPSEAPSTNRSGPRQGGRSNPRGSTNYDQEGLGLNAPLTVISGIGPKYAETLANLELHTLSDLLYHFPRRYIDYSQLKTINRLKYGEDATILATVQSINNRPFQGGKGQITEVIVGDGTGSLRLNWFNQPWQANRFRAGDPVNVSGKVAQLLGRPVMSNPECETLDQDQLHTNRIVPIYPLTASVTQRWLRRVMYQTVNYWSGRVIDYLPIDIRQSIGMYDLATALRQSHFPDSMDRLSRARERLAFDEIFLLQLGVLRQKRNWESVSAPVYTVPDEWLQSFLNQLPFQLTNAQIRALSDVRAGLTSGVPMERLLQGDVGSGKTIIAALGAAVVMYNGAQVAIMAPTGILAAQHYRSISRLLCGEPPAAEPLEDGQSSEQPRGIFPSSQIRLLLGDTTEAEKVEIRAGLADGSIRLVIGTHALIESDITFQDLRFVVIDEQHRFGVAQRYLLRSKGSTPHLLLMTATPIPRSLALTLYGDLDLSVMDEMPPGRQPIETHILEPRERERAYTLIASQVAKGYQAFIIYPQVEAGDNETALAAVEQSERIQKTVFPRLKIGLLHGRMRPDEKDEIMRQFRDRQYDVLVSTSVVEVGVDIPNATVMLVEGANRFGLAQLHQFRGRVGRGNVPSYCLLIPEKEDAVENERLAAMAETNNGFILAERDLSQRGPGDFLGTRQAGYAELKMANLSDIKLIEKARVQAQALFAKDPDLRLPEHQLLVENLNRFWQIGQGDIS